MPELPEVETTRRGIEPHVKGRKIRQLLVRDHRLRWPVDAGIPQSVSGQSVISVSRRAKYLLLELDKGWLMLHLGMSGSLRILPAGTPPETHDHVDVLFDSNQVLRFRDPRRFGSLFYMKALDHPLLSKLGPEPLSEDFSVDYLMRRAKQVRRNIKTFLMDAEIVVGVGNIYANEALFYAGIRPLTEAGKVRRARMARLVPAVKMVLAKAIDAGGTSLRDFLREDGKPGYFRHELQVYGREGEACYACEGPLTSLRISNRATVYCRRCQR
ncbi:MAG: bifunctional DNA-formamidopyrimidine glycosylase/DNA-(apurinic or apyrimidinic site) lyase [Pseudomonadales bacterium]